MNMRLREWIGIHNQNLFLFISSAYVSMSCVMCVQVVTPQTSFRKKTIKNKNNNKNKKNNKMNNKNKNKKISAETKAFKGLWSGEGWTQLS